MEALMLYFNELDNVNRNFDNFGIIYKAKNDKYKSFLFRNTLDK